MKRPVTTFRCESCDRLIDIEKEFYINVESLEAKVNLPVDEKKFELVDAKVDRRWDSYSCAVCSEGCLSHLINNLARKAWVDNNVPITEDAIQ